MSPKIHTIEENYEYRLKYIVLKVLDQIDGDIENLDGDQLAELLWKHSDTLGKELVRDMYEWMSEDEWLNLVKDG